MYAFGANNESGIRSRQVPVWKGLISIVLSVIHSGPNYYYGIDRIPVCTGSGMYRLHSNSEFCVVPRYLKIHGSTIWNGTIEYTLHVFNKIQITSFTDLHDVLAVHIHI